MIRGVRGIRTSDQTLSDLSKAEVAGAIESTDHDWYVFELAQGERVQITAWQTTNDLVPSLKLYVDPTENHEAGNSHGDPGRTHVLKSIANETGDYYLKFQINNSITNYNFKNDDGNLMGNGPQ